MPTLSCRYSRDYLRRKLVGRDKLKYVTKVFSTSIPYSISRVQRLSLPRYVGDGSRGKG